MKEQIDELVLLIGLDKNTVQVFENDDENEFTLFYPNHMQNVVLPNDKTDKELLDVMQKLMEEHVLDVTKDIQMIKRYRKVFE